MFEFPGKETIQSDIGKAIIDDGNGNIWIGTNSKGIYILNEQADNLMHIQELLFPCRAITLIVFIKIIRIFCGLERRSRGLRLLI